MRELQSFRMPTNKRIRLELKDKVAIIDKLKKGVKRKLIADEYGVDVSTLSKLLKKSEQVEQALGEGCSADNKSMKTAKRPDIEKQMVEWINSTTSKNITISRAEMKTKWIAIAESLGVNNFTASNGYIERFIRRNNIALVKFRGEASTVSESTVENWKPKLQQLIKDYNAYDIYNMDELGLFYQEVPRKTYAVKGTQVKGHKFSKTRVTVLLTANMTGTHKLLPLVIGKCENPRCFKNVKRKPCIYRSNTKAWMTTTIFNEYLKKLNSHFIQTNRKVLFFADNHITHVKAKKYSNIKLEFFPANTTSVLQPLDQGVISTFKLKYRQSMIKHMIEQHCLNPQFNFQSNKITILQALHWIHEAWMTIEPKTIVNCFRKAYFFKSNDSNEPVDEQNTTVDQCPLQEFSQEFNVEISNMEEYLAIDDGLPCHENEDDNYVEPSDEGQEKEEPEEISRANKQEVFRALETIRLLNLYESNDSLFLAYKNLKTAIECIYANNSIQTSISDFLKTKE